MFIMSSTQDAGCVACLPQLAYRHCLPNLCRSSSPYLQCPALPGFFVELHRVSVPLNKMKAWLQGDEAMPLMLYELLAFRVRCEMPATAGMFAGWHIVDGQRFTGPNLDHKGGLHWTDIDRMPEFRRADSVASRQADLIERLTKERDFYKRQCWLETRHGLLFRST